MNFMQNYAAGHDYNVFFDNCETAALGALNQAGVENAQFMPFMMPSQMYDWLSFGKQTGH
jgi:hypothetical protein